MAGTLLLLVGFWLYQMKRVQRWLRNPEPPPETYGIWGDILSEIYQLQKKAGGLDRLQSTVDYLQDSFPPCATVWPSSMITACLKWFNESARALLLGLRPADKGQSLMNPVRAPEFCDISTW